MKRKRTGDQPDGPQACDLVLTDARGRSIKVHKALLIDRSDYFAAILQASNLRELQLNESYLLELIQYLYEHDPEDVAGLRPELAGAPPGDEAAAEGNLARALDQESSISTGDLEILMQLLWLSDKYGFGRLRAHLLAEINFKLAPSTALTIYRSASQLGIGELRASSRLMVLSCLPQLQTTGAFLSLPAEAVADIFAAECWSVESESKLNALSVWWSQNPDSDMTQLWAKLVTATQD